MKFAWPWGDFDCREGGVWGQIAGAGAPCRFPRGGFGPVVAPGLGKPPDLVATSSNWRTCSFGLPQSLARRDLRAKSCSRVFSTESRDPWGFHSQVSPLILKDGRGALRHGYVRVQLGLRRAWVDVLLFPPRRSMHRRRWARVKIRLLR